MSAGASGNVYIIPEFENRLSVFHDRAHAGRILADMLTSFRKGKGIVFAIPAGGVPVAAEIARNLDLPLDIAVASKLTFPWNTEAGYGAIAFDGSVRLNDMLVAESGLAEEEVEVGVKNTLAKVRRRVQKFRGNRAFPLLEGRPAIVVDDGLASGFTVMVVIEALRKAGAHEIVLAVPTASQGAIQRVSVLVEALYCANLRSGRIFAVADAYEKWSDVTEEEVLDILKSITPASSD
jgi:putative phosphoribosyl transferase